MNLGPRLIGISFLFLKFKSSIEQGAFTLLANLIFLVGIVDDVAESSSECTVVPDLRYVLLSTGFVHVSINE